MKISGKLRGWDELSDKFKDLPAKVQRKVVQPSVTAAIREGRKAVKAAAPVRKDKRSQASLRYGSLKDNIRLIRLKRNPKGVFGARVDTGNAFWGAFLDSGYTIERGSRYQPGNNWFLNAFNSAIDRIFEVLATRLGKGIEKVAGEK